MKGYRTLIWSVAIAVIGVIEITNFAPLIPDRYEGWALLGIALVTAILRAATDTALGGNK